MQLKLTFVVVFAIVFHLAVSANAYDWYSVKTVDQLSKVPVDEFKDMTGGELEHLAKQKICAGLTASQIHNIKDTVMVDMDHGIMGSPCMDKISNACSGFTKAQMAQLPNKSFTAMSQKCLSSLSLDSCAGVNRNAFNFLSEISISGLSVECIRHFDKSAFSGGNLDIFRSLSDAQCSGFTGEQVSSMDISYLESLRPTCIANFSTKEYLKGPNSGCSGINSNVFSHLQYDDVAKITSGCAADFDDKIFIHANPEDLVSLTPSACSGLSKEVIANTNINAISGFEPSCIGALSDSSFNAFGVNMDKISSKACGSITPSQIEHVTDPTNFSKLTTECIQNFSKPLLRSLTINNLQLFTNFDGFCDKMDIIVDELVAKSEASPTPVSADKVLSSFLDSNIMKIAKPKCFMSLKPTFTPVYHITDSKDLSKFNPLKMAFIEPSDFAKVDDLFDVHHKCGIRADAAYYLNSMAISTIDEFSIKDLNIDFFAGIGADFVKTIVSATLKSLFHYEVKTDFGVVFPSQRFPAVSIPALTKDQLTEAFFDAKSVDYLCAQQARAFTETQKSWLTTDVQEALKTTKMQACPTPKFQTFRETLKLSNVKTSKDLSTIPADKFASITLDDFNGIQNKKICNGYNADQIKNIPSDIFKSMGGPCMAQMTQSCNGITKDGFRVLSKTAIKSLTKECVSNFDINNHGACAGVDAQNFGWMLPAVIPSIRPFCMHQFANDVFSASFPTLIQALTNEQCHNIFGPVLEKMHETNIQSLRPSCVANFSTLDDTVPTPTCTGIVNQNFSYFTDECVFAMTGKCIKSFGGYALLHATEYQIGAFNPESCKGFSGTGLLWQIPPKSLAGLKPGCFVNMWEQALEEFDQGLEYLSVECCKLISVAQFKYLSDTNAQEFKYFSKECLAALSDEVLDLLTYDDVRATAEFDGYCFHLDKAIDGMLERKLAKKEGGVTAANILKDINAGQVRLIDNPECFYSLKKTFKPAYNIYDMPTLQDMNSLQIAFNNPTDFARFDDFAPLKAKAGLRADHAYYFHENAVKKITKDYIDDIMYDFWAGIGPDYVSYLADDVIGALFDHAGIKVPAYGEAIFPLHFLPIVSIPEITSTQLKLGLSTPYNVKYMCKEQAKAITATQKTWLPANIVAALTDAETDKLTACPAPRFTQFRKIDAFEGIMTKEDLSKADPNLFKTINSVEFETLQNKHICAGFTAAQLANIPPAIFGNVEASCLEALVPKSCAGFTKDAISNIDSVALGSMSTQCLANFNPDTGCKGINSDNIFNLVVQSFTTECIMNFDKMVFSIATSAVMESFTDEQCVGFVGDQVANINIKAIPSIRPTCIKNFSTNYTIKLPFHSGCSGLNEKVFPRLSHDAISEITEQCAASMDSKALSNIDGSIGAVLTANICKGVGDNVKYIDSAAIGKLETTCVSAMVEGVLVDLDKNVAYLKSDGCNGITVAQWTNLAKNNIALLSLFTTDCVSGLNENILASLTYDEVLKIKHIDGLCLHLDEMVDGVIARSPTIGAKKILDSYESIDDIKKIDKPLCFSTLSDDFKPVYHIAKSEEFDKLYPLQKAFVFPEDYSRLQFSRLPTGITGIRGVSSYYFHPHALATIHQSEVQDANIDFLAGIGPDFVTFISDECMEQWFNLKIIGQYDKAIYPIHYLPIVSLQKLTKNQLLAGLPTKESVYSLCKEQMTGFTAIQVSWLPADIKEALKTYGGVVRNCPQPKFKTFRKITTWEKVLNLQDLQKVPEEAFRTITVPEFLSIQDKALCDALTSAQVANIPEKVLLGMGTECMHNMNDSCQGLSGQFVRDASDELIDAMGYPCIQAFNTKPYGTCSGVNADNLSKFVNHISYFTTRCISFFDNKVLSKVDLNTLESFSDDQCEGFMDKQIATMNPKMVSNLRPTCVANFSTKTVTVDSGCAGITKDIFVGLSEDAVADISANCAASLPVDVFSTSSGLQIEALQNNACSRLSYDVISNMSEDAVSGLQPECFNALNNRALTALGAKIGNISSKTCASITVEQMTDLTKSITNFGYFSELCLSNLSVDVYKSLTYEEVKNVKHFHGFCNHLDSAIDGVIARGAKAHPSISGETIFNYMPAASLNSVATPECFASLKKDFKPIYHVDTINKLMTMLPLEIAFVDPVDFSQFRDFSGITNPVGFRSDAAYNMHEEGIASFMSTDVENLMFDFFAGIGPDYVPYVDVGVIKALFAIKIESIYHGLVFPFEYLPAVSISKLTKDQLQQSLTTITNVHHMCQEQVHALTDIQKSWLSADVVKSLNDDVMLLRHCPIAKYTTFRQIGVFEGIGSADDLAKVSADKFKTLTADQLLSIEDKNICDGFTSEQIANIPFGTITQIGPDCMSKISTGCRGFDNKAIGAMNKFVIQAMGEFCIGNLSHDSENSGCHGIDKSVFEYLTLVQVSYFSNECITQFDSKVFSTASSKQINSFSDNQCEAFNSNQVSWMNIAAVSKLRVSCIGSFSTSGKTSGCGGIDPEFFDQMDWKAISALTKECLAVVHPNTFSTAKQTSMQQLTPAACSGITYETITSFGEGAVKGIQPDCFKNLNSGALNAMNEHVHWLSMWNCKQITSDMIKAISAEPSKTFKYMSGACIDALSIGALKAITVYDVEITEEFNGYCHHLGDIIDPMVIANPNTFFDDVEQVDDIASPQCMSSLAKTYHELYHVYDAGDFRNMNGLKASYVYKKDMAKVTTFDDVQATTITGIRAEATEFITGDALKTISIGSFKHLQYDFFAGISPKKMTTKMTNEQIKTLFALEVLDDKLGPVHPVRHVSIANIKSLSKEQLVAAFETDLVANNLCMGQLKALTPTQISWLTPKTQQEILDAKKGFQICPVETRFDWKPYEEKPASHGGSFMKLLIGFFVIALIAGGIFLAIRKYHLKPKSDDASLHFVELQDDHVGINL